MSPEWEAIGKLKSKDYLNCASSLKVHLSWLILEQTKDLKKKKKQCGRNTWRFTGSSQKYHHTPASWLGHSSNNTANILGKGTNVDRSK